MTTKNKREIIIEGILEINGKNGFVRPEGEYAGRFEDIYVSPDRLERAFDGDRVAVSVSLPIIKGRRPEGKIEKIIQTGPRIYAGTVRNRGGKLVFEPEGKKRKIFGSAELTGDMKNVQEGYGVTFYLEKYNLRTNYFSGHIEEIIGVITEAGVDISTILAGFGIEGEFPQEVTEALTDVPDKLTGQSAAAKVKRGRMDFRSLKIITIDSETTKDVDDGVSLEINPEGNYVLGVHIADVSEYVAEGSPIDREAYKRGTSVYPLDRVVPMLPPKLSNGICSLNVGENRLALSVMITYDEKGNVLRKGFYESVIKVFDKITYRQVYGLLEKKDPELQNKYNEITEMLKNMRKLASVLKEKRKEAGALDFDFPEISVELGEDGKPVSLGKIEKTFANDMIEEFMVAANMAVAEKFCREKIPFMYRIHREPETEKIERLGLVVKSMGGKSIIPKGHIKPATVASMINSVKGKPGENAVNYLALRSLQKAEYYGECLGHFGLAAEYYTHFTSPIRRYPDLFIHRIIKKVLRGEMNPGAERHFREIKDEAAENCSATERKAAEAEMSVRDYKVVQYMERFTGEAFEGEISSITGFGFYVRLDNMAEGLVNYNSVPDYIDFDEINMRAVGRKTGVSFRPGQKVRIIVEKADPETRQLDFRLEGNVRYGSVKPKTSGRGRSVRNNKNFHGRGKKSSKRR